MLASTRPATRRRPLCRAPRTLSGFGTCSGRGLRPMARSRRCDRRTTRPWFRWQARAGTDGRRSRWPDARGVRSHRVSRDATGTSFAPPPLHDGRRECIYGRIDSEKRGRRERQAGNVGEASVRESPTARAGIPSGASRPRWRRPRRPHGVSLWADGGHSRLARSTVSRPVGHHETTPGRSCPGKPGRPVTTAPEHAVVAPRTTTTSGWFTGDLNGDGLYCDLANVSKRPPPHGAWATNRIPPIRLIVYQVRPTGPSNVPWALRRHAQQRRRRWTQWVIATRRGRHRCRALAREPRPLLCRCFAGTTLPK